MQSIPTRAANDCRLVLPPVIHAVVGTEVNVYFDNVVLAPPGRSYLFAVHCAKGRQQEERWTFLPVAADVGEFPLAIEVRNLDDQVVANGTTTVHVAAADAGHGRAITLLAIGDSLTHASAYTGELMKLFATTNGPTLKLVGTHHVKDTAEGNVHEGYGGWKYRDFVEKYEPNPVPGDHGKRSSPFVFASTNGPVFDVARYVREQLGGTPPDFVTIFLGPNDFFFATDKDREATITGILEYADKLLAGIRSAAPRAKIGLLPPIPPTASQDGFGDNYGCQQTRWEYRKSQHRMVEKMLTKYGNRESDGIYIVPAFVNFDCRHNYPENPNSPANARTAVTVPRVTNAAHPAMPGYFQIADCIYAWIKNLTKVTP